MNRPYGQPSRSGARYRRNAFALLGLFVLSACVAPAPQPEVSRLFQQAPEGALPGTCWGKTAKPAVIETVTEQVLVQPAARDATGAEIAPAIYRTETRQRIVQERQETWFERPCEDVMTEEFVASLQRALSARGKYVGPITGVMDARTQAAVRVFQAEDGIDSGMLSVTAARRLGLWAVERPRG